MTLSLKSRLSVTPLLVVWLMLSGACDAPRQAGPGLTDPAACLESPAEAGGSRFLPPFHMKDHLGGEAIYPGFSDKPVIIILGDATTGEENTLWGQWIEASFGDRICLYRILDLASVPRVFESLVISRLREAIETPGIALLMDWEGKVAHRLDLPEGVTSVVLADRNGRVLCAVSGFPDEAKKEILLKKGGTVT